MIFIEYVVIQLYLDMGFPHPERFQKSRYIF